MFEATVIKKITGNGMEFFEGDMIRVLMKPKDYNRPDHANEYIGFIYEIHKDYFELRESFNSDYRVILINRIDRMRLTKEGETFANTWNFDD